MTKYIASNKEWLNSRIKWTQAEIKGDQRTASQLRHWIQEPVEWIVIKTQTVITVNVL